MARSSLLALAFVNATIDQYDKVADQVATDSRLTPLTVTHDGIEQITQTVQNYRSQIHGLHLISADPAGSLKFGSTTLTLFNLDRYGWQLQQWGDALVPQATIFFHRWQIAPATVVTAPTSTLLLARLQLLTSARILVRDYPIPTVQSTSHSA
jgi:Domain of unknown function (DUF4347)